MNICKKCGENIRSEAMIDGRLRYFYGRKLCLKCQPFVYNRKIKTKCRDCGIEYRWYHGNPEGNNMYRCNKCKQKPKHTRTEIKARCVEYKGGACERCGYNKCNRSLDFHHVTQDKVGGISQLSRTLSWEELKIELDKCILVCKNCHFELHDEAEQLRRQGKLSHGPSLSLEAVFQSISRTQ